MSLHFEDIEYRYRRGSEGLFCGLNYEFLRGTVTALTGPSGRGKTTLLYIAGLLIRPTGGQVRLGDEVISNRSDSQRARLRARRFGFVFQDASLDPARPIRDSVVEPALYAGHDRRKALQRAEVLLRRFGVDHRFDHRPGEISGGQAQRVAVCRALMNSPDVILADEPTGNLDRENGQLVLQALRDEALQGRIVLIATHDQSVAETADHVLSLH